MKKENSYTRIGLAMKLGDKTTRRPDPQASSGSENERATGWSGPSERAWNALLNAGLTLSEADTIVRVIAPSLRSKRTTIGSTTNRAVLGCAKTRNNGRYNGNGREWETPPEVFNPLHAEFSFTLDPCATAANAKCERYFTEAINGLEQSWDQERVFMNPPYGREIYAWTRKAREAAAQGAHVVGLLPASTDLAWWHDEIVGHAEVRYIRGRVRFLTDGPYRASGFFPSVVVIWRRWLTVASVPATEVSAPEMVGAVLGSIVAPE